MAARVLARRADRNGAPITPVELEIVARAAGLHPELVRRYFALGVIELGDRVGAARLARFARLRRDLALNCSGALLAMDLLARIDELEARLARYESPRPPAEVR
ncbi:MAG: chaperone modulatory protein CbpM [Thermoleophilales bacterium]|nr:chaperone modulatory protein CbpM [Thermoleophilales bacterium]